MSESSRHPCARCAEMQRTCCQRTEILLTRGDVARIERHVVRRDFHERRVPADPAYLEPQPDDPNWLPWTVAPDGTRRMLKREANGDCTFLGPQGCTLPQEARPLVCRLYPLEYTQDGLVGEQPEYCPVAALQPPDGRMSRMLGMSDLDARVWHAMLYRELAEEDDEGRPHLRSA